MMKTLSEVNIDQITEVDDNTALSEELACAGGACEIT